MRGNQKKKEKTTSYGSNNNESHMSIKNVFSSIVHSRYAFKRVNKCMANRVTVVMIKWL